MTDSTAMTATSFVDELTWRGLVYQATDGLVPALAAGTVSGYCGFDATAPSLHLGHLVPVMGLVHLQRAGHRPVALVGGGTGLIGDPSGKTAERQLNTKEVVAANAASIRRQLERFLDFSGPTGALVRDNADWLMPLHAVDFLRDVGKHFTVNYMMAKDSVKSRLDGGISFTEFAYMLLQAYDFLELHRRDAVTLQIGGSDQWGNITAGAELIRRTTAGEAHALTMPLITTAAGTKFGKTEAGSVWLDANQTSPFAFYQFWINTDDRDAGRYLRYFTLLPREEIEALDREIAERPERRAAQLALAADVTTRVHGQATARIAVEISQALFGHRDPHELSSEALEAMETEVPFARVPRPGGPGWTTQSDAAGVASERSPSGAPEEVDVLDLFVSAKLTNSKGAARRLLEQGGMYVNGRRVPPGERTIGPDALLHGRYLLLRKGARDYGLIRIVD